MDPFLFYILCEKDEEGAHIVGYFSKVRRDRGGSPRPLRQPRVLLPTYLPSRTHAVPERRRSKAPRITTWPVF